MMLEKTGWPHPPLMQDDNYDLARWFSSKPEARWLVRQACAEIEKKRKERESAQIGRTLPHLG